MSDDVLLRFVGRALIDVGGDDAKLERLRQAASDLSEILKEAPTKTLAFSLAAFDADIPETDPAVTESADALRRRWETYVNTFPSTPVVVCRAILTDALARAARDNEAVAIGFAACARNLLPFMEVGGEQEIWVDIVAEVEREVEERATAQWATPASIEPPSIKLDSISQDENRVSGKELDKRSLTKQLLGAAGPNFINPQNNQNQSTEGNPHFPNQNEHWVYEFGTRAGQAIGGAIETIMERLSAQDAGLSENVNNITAAISGHLANTIQTVSVATAGLQRRTSLLWWKEALFSPSVCRSYRDLPVFSAAALMAFDLHQLIPGSSPISVAAFLRETVNTLQGLDGNRKATIRELVENAGGSCDLAELRAEAARLVPAPMGRGPLLGLIGHPELLSQIDNKGFRDLAGVGPDTLFSLPDWSVWLLREFQAARTLVEAPPLKRRASPRRQTPGK